MIGHLTHLDGTFKTVRTCACKRNAPGHCGRWRPSFQFFQLHREQFGRGNATFSAIRDERRRLPSAPATNHHPFARMLGTEGKRREGSRCRRRRGVGEARQSVDLSELMPPGLAPPAPYVRAQPELRAVAISVAGTFGLLPAWPLRRYLVPRLEC
jgi:hypothetical protein